MAHKYIPLPPNISYYLDSKTNKEKFSDNTKTFKLL